MTILPLESYYERELSLFHQPADELGKYFAKVFAGEARAAVHFAEQYPEPAGRLSKNSDAGPDPHADRFVEAFAMLAGRIHYQIDRSLPHMTEAIRNVVYPHFFRPIPSMSIAQFTTEQDGKQECLFFPKGLKLLSRGVGKHHIPCQWRTGYPVYLWPVRVVEAELQSSAFFDRLNLPARTPAVLRIRLECAPGCTFSDMRIDRLRFYLSGSRAVVASLYEVLFHTVKQVWFLDAGGSARPTVMEPEQALAPVGFELDEGLIPYPCESFIGYRLIQELFHFPQKFHFVDLHRLDRAREQQIGRRMDVLCLLDRLPEELSGVVDAGLFQLGCTPVVNLFEKLAEPIALNQTRHEYKVVPDRNSPFGTEVFSVDAVGSFDPNNETIKDFHPFYHIDFGEDHTTQKAFWYASRRPSAHDLKTTDVFLVLVDRDFDPFAQANQTVNVHVTCTNRELPLVFLRSGDHLAVSQSREKFNGTIRLLSTPTSPRRPIMKQGSLWQFVTQNAISHVGLSDDVDGINVLKKTLALCAWSEAITGDNQLPAVTRRLIEGIKSFKAAPIILSVWSGKRPGRCRGMSFSLELDIQKYIGTGTFLFASVLERFLGLYASVNSFSQLSVATKQGEGFSKKWPPRSVDQVLV